LKHQEQLNAWGLEFSQLGNDSIVIRSLPFLYNIPACQINIEDFIHWLIKEIKCASQADLSIIFLHSLKNSILTHSLTASEQKQLLNLLSEQIAAAKQPETFIKNQSIWIVLDEKQLDKMLGKNPL
ncbi:MAG: hypothetical protein KAI17_17935, partial [Thiotrichaceae bacterium]|nr:hypothetical protein [Thiotrichaceae bacterium]